MKQNNKNASNTYETQQIKYTHIHQDHNGNALVQRKHKNERNGNIRTHEQTRSESKLIEAPKERYSYSHLNKGKCESVGMKGPQL